MASQHDQRLAARRRRLSPRRRLAARRPPPQGQQGHAARRRRISRSPKTPLRRALGAVDREDLRDRIRLDQRALREGGEALLQRGRLARRDARGGLGLAQRAQPAARSAIGGGGCAVHPPTLGGKAFYVALDAHDEADRKLRDAVVTADALKAADAEVREAKARRDRPQGPARGDRPRHRQAPPRPARCAETRAARCDRGGAREPRRTPTFAASDLAQARAALEADKGKRAELRSARRGGRARRGGEGRARPRRGVGRARARDRCAEP